MQINADFQLNNLGCYGFQLDFHSSVLGIVFLTVTNQGMVLYLFYKPLSYFLALRKQLGVGMDEPRKSQGSITQQISSLEGRKASNANVLNTDNSKTSGQHMSSLRSQPSQQAASKKAKKKSTAETITSLLKRSFCAAVLCFFWDFVSFAICIFIPRTYPLVLFFAFIDAKLFVNVLCLLGAFEDWRTIILPFCSFANLKKIKQNSNKSPNSKRTFTSNRV